MRQTVLKLLRITAGFLILILGLIIWPLPIPLGLILCATAVWILSRDIRLFRKYLIWLRQKLKQSRNKAREPVD